jgi:flagellar motor switch protein FliG
MTMERCLSDSMTSDILEQIPHDNREILQNFLANEHIKCVHFD